MSIFWTNDQLPPLQSSTNDSFHSYYVVSGFIGLVRHWLVDRPEWTTGEVVEKSLYLMKLSDPNR